MKPAQRAVNKLTMLIASGGVLLTTYQLILLLLNRDTVCFNDGCEIVEGLTTVPPEVFNGAGLLYFAFIFIVVKFTKKDDGPGTYLTSILLLSGLAAEGVLIAFQHFIISTFCSYCLIIFSIIVLLNLFRGLKHFIIGAAIFIAIQIAFMSLQFSPPASSSEMNISAGTTATIKGQKGDKDFFLFFSSTCPHCEEVIATLKSSPEYTIHFNPIDDVKSIDVEGAPEPVACDTDINRSFLGLFGVTKIPALYQKSDNGYTLTTSKNEIVETLQQECYPAQARPAKTIQSGFSPANPVQNQTFKAPKVDEGNCDINTDC